MARVLIISNHHPNEGGVAIPVARRVAELLRGQGHIVVYEKLPYKGSNLHLPFMEGEVHQFETVAGKGWRRSTDQAINEARKEFKNARPDFVLNFHCTPSDKRIWKDPEFRIQTAGKYPAKIREHDIIVAKQGELTNPTRLLVEINAVYTDLPQRVQARMRKDVLSLYSAREKQNYLLRVANLRQTLRRGVSVDAFAQGISRVFQQKLKGRGVNNLFDFDAYGNAGVGLSLRKKRRMGRIRKLPIKR